MNEEERKKRIAEIEDTIFRIEVGSDYLSSKDWDYLRELRKELKELKEKND